MNDPDRLFYTILACILGIGIVLFALPARSETVISERAIGQGGLICDTEKEVSDFIAIAEKSTAQAALEEIAGCGILQRPMAIRVILLDEVQTDKARYLIVRYEFLDHPHPAQYGIGGRALRGASL